jgi:hypothetical protein
MDSAFQYDPEPDSFTTSTAPTISTWTLAIGSTPLLDSAARVTLSKSKLNYVSLLLRVFDGPTSLHVKATPETVALNPSAPSLPLLLCSSTLLLKSTRCSWLSASLTSSPAQVAFPFCWTFSLNHNSQLSPHLPSAPQLCCSCSVVPIFLSLCKRCLNCLCWKALTSYLGPLEKSVAFPPPFCTCCPLLRAFLSYSHLGIKGED